MKIHELDPYSLPLSGTRIIEASAGTGKTFTISLFYTRLILEAGLSPESILAVTFTEAATAGLRDRIREQLSRTLAEAEGLASPPPAGAGLLAGLDPERSRQRLQYALASLDLAAISTIHGFCRRVLTEHSFEALNQYGRELVPDQAGLFREVADDFWARETFDAEPLQVKILEDSSLSLAAYASSSRERIQPLVEGRTGGSSARSIRDQMIELLRLGACQPEACPLPPRQSAGAVREEFRQAWQALRQAWQAGRGEIGQMLQDRNRFDAKKFSGRYLPRWLDEVEDFLAPAAPASHRFPRLIGRLSPEWLVPGESLKPGVTLPGHPVLDACRRLVEAWLELPAIQADFLHRLWKYGRTELSRRRQILGQMAFDDLLADVDRALSGPAGRRLAGLLAGRYRAALIDEFQDTDGLQYRIFQRIFQQHGHPLLLIGDPKQAIYSFRGADVFTYLRAVRENGSPVSTLRWNWRSDPPLIEAVNSLFQLHPRPFHVEDIGFHPVEAAPRTTGHLTCDGVPAAPLRFVWLPPVDGQASGDSPVPAAMATTLAARRAADHLAGLLRSNIRLGHPPRPLTPADTAILVGKNQQAILIQRELRRLCIPSVLYSELSVLQSEEAAELFQVLTAVAGPAGPGQIRAALATVLLGVSGDQLLALRDDSPAWEWWLQKLRSWKQHWVSRGVLAAVREILSAPGPLDGPPNCLRLLGYPDGERRLTNFNHLAEILEEAARDRQLPPELLPGWLARERENPGAAAANRQLRLESDAGAVRLITIHKCKGLEFPVTLCPFLWDASSSGPAGPFVCHRPEPPYPAVLEFGSAGYLQHRERASLEQQAEETRLLYVALTRARHLCLIYWGHLAGHGRSALGRLLYYPDSPPDTGAEIKNRIEQISSRLQPLTGFEELPASFTGQPLEPAGGDTLLACRSLSRKITPQWRMTSFSALARHEPVEEPDTLPEDTGAELLSLTRTETGPVIMPGAGRPANLPLGELPRGNLTGLCLHTILEKHFDALASRSLAPPAILPALLRAGLSADPWAERLPSILSGILAVELRPGLRLGEIPARQRRSEFPFVFPVALTNHEIQPPFRLRQAARLLRRSNDPLYRRYAPRLEHLDGEGLRGMVKGYIDLVFHHGEKWYLLDYKSNHLGERWEDYLPGPLEEAMLENHYPLQALLYTIALDRHLARQLPRYNYSRHFGGIFYLFLRGMGNPDFPGGGVHFHCPEHSLIEELAGLSGPAGDVR